MLPHLVDATWREFTMSGAIKIGPRWMDCRPEQILRAGVAWDAGEFLRYTIDSIR